MENKASVTFALLAYNQEKFIRSAIKGALAQTHRPLQIILSDDCSTDHTFEFMQEVVDSLSGNCKEIEIKLNRTSENRGLVNHINSVVGLASGRLLVLAAGDDISEPVRVAQIYERWRRSGFASGSIFSCYTAITEEEKELGEGGKESFRSNDSWQRTEDHDPNIFYSSPGCTQAVTVDTFDFFGGLPLGIIQEDLMLQLRSSLIGGVGFVDMPLVRYRITTSSQSRDIHIDSKDKRAKRVRYLKSYHKIFKQYEKDCYMALEASLIDEKTYRWAIIESRNFAIQFYQEYKLLSGNLIEKLKVLLSSAVPLKRRCRWLLYLVFPDLYGFRSRIKHQRKLRT